jgi:hypothetical protein
MFLFRFSTCFEQPCAHHQESQLYQYIWYMSLCVGDRTVNAGREGIVHHVGYLLELYRDARSPEYKTYTS